MPSSHLPPGVHLKRHGTVLVQRLHHDVTLVHGSAGVAHGSQRHGVCGAPEATDEEGSGPLGSARGWPQMSLMVAFVTVALTPSDLKVPEPDPHGLHRCAVGVDGDLRYFVFA